MRGKGSRWSSNSVDGKALKALLATGQITENMTTMDVQNLYPQFQSYPNNNFAGNLRRERQKTEDQTTTQQNDRMTASVVVPRTTQAPVVVASNSAGVRIQRGMTPTSSIGTNDLAESFGRMGVQDEHEEEDDFAVGGLPVLGASSSSVQGLLDRFSTCPTQMMNFFYAATWFDQYGSRRATYYLLMPSIPQDNISINIERGGTELIVAMRLPSLLNSVEELTNAMFKNPDGSPVYRSDHIRTVALQQAQMEMRKALRSQHGDSVIFQRMKLPFKCEQIPTGREGRCGLTVKSFKNHMRIAVVELKEVDKTPQRLVDYFSPGRKQQVEFDNVSQMFGTMAGGDGYHLDGKSVVTIKPSDFNGIYMRSDPVCLSDPRYVPRCLPAGIPEEVSTGKGEDGDYEYDIESEYTEITQKSCKKRNCPSSGKSVRSAQSVRSLQTGVEDDNKVAAASTTKVAGAITAAASTTKVAGAVTAAASTTSVKSPPMKLSDSTMMEN